MLSYQSKTHLNSDIWYPANWWPRKKNQTTKLFRSHTLLSRAVNNRRRTPLVLMSKFTKPIHPLFPHDICYPQSKSDWLWSLEIFWRSTLCNPNDVFAIVKFQFHLWQISEIMRPVCYPGSFPNKWRTQRSYYHTTAFRYAHQFCQSFFKSDIKASHTHPNLGDRFV